MFLILLEAFFNRTTWCSVIFVGDMTTTLFYCLVNTKFYLNLTTSTNFATFFTNVHHKCHIMQTVTLFRPFATSWVVVFAFSVNFLFLCYNNGRSRFSLYLFLNVIHIRFLAYTHHSYKGCRSDKTICSYHS